MSLVSTEWLDNNYSDVKIIDSSWHMPNTNRNAYEEYKKEHIENATFLTLINSQTKKRNFLICYPAKKNGKKLFLVQSLLL